MEIAGTYTLEAPQQLVWVSLLDPNVLGSIMPGGKGFEQSGENQYTGMLEVKVGPVQGTFQGQIKLFDIIAPEHYQIEVDGKGAPGFVKATGKLQLQAQGAQTHMEYSGQAQVGGRIASVGQRLIDSAARSIIRQSLEALNEYLRYEAAKQEAEKLAAAAAAPAPVVVEAHAAPAVVAAPPAPAVIPPPQYKPPSQMALGLQVARDVISDFVPEQYWVPLLVTVVIVAAVLIIFGLASQ